MRMAFHQISLYMVAGKRFSFLQVTLSGYLRHLHYPAAAMEL